MEQRERQKTSSVVAGMYHLLTRLEDQSQYGISLMSGLNIQTMNSELEFRKILAIVMLISTQLVNIRPN